MPGLVPRATLKGAGYALMEKFALPSERKAFQQMNALHDAYNTPFATKTIAAELGQGAESADDLLAGALNSRLTDSAASLERHAPETQSLVEKIYQRIRTLGEKRASKVPQAIQTLQEMATTPERQRLLEEAMPYLERELSRPGIKRAWLAGSYGTAKKTPSDIDLVIHPNQAYREDFHQRIRDTISQDTKRRLAQEAGDVPGQEAASQKMRELGTRFGLSRFEHLPVDTLRVGNFADPTAPTLKEIRTVGRERYGDDYKFTRLLQATLAAVGGGAASLLSPDEAEAAPKPRLNAAQLAKLKEEAWPVAKELLKPDGAVRFDVSRRWWSSRMEGGGLFWDRRNDEGRFLSWVSPYLAKAKEIDPKWAAKAEEFIELGKQEGRPKYFELALQHLHRVLTHESSGANAVAEMMSKYGHKEVSQALLENAGSVADKEILYSTLKYWEYLSVLAAVGLGGMGLAGEAEAGGLKVPKKLTETAASKFGMESSASRKLAGMDLLGKTVKEIRKGNGNWRYVVFEDGTYLPLDKKYIASLSSSEGEKLYGTMFDMSTPTDQKLMLGRSQAIFRARNTPSKLLRETLAERKGLLEDLGETAPERVTTLLEGKKKDIPSSYAWGVMKYGDQGKIPTERFAPPKEKAAEIKLKDIVGTSIKTSTPVKEPPKVKNPLERSIYNLEKAKATKGISKGDEYMLRRFKGMPPEQAAEGLKLISPGSIERMVLRILEESKK